MEPASAFALAGTIFQFTEAGGKFVVLALKFHRSQAEALATFTELRELADQFDQILTTLGASAHNPGGPDEDQTGFIPLAGECRKVIIQIRKMLEKFRPETNRKRRKRDAIKFAFNSMWSENEITSLKSKLEGLRAQMMFHLLASLRQHVNQTPNQQEETLRTLGVDSQRTFAQEHTTEAIVKFLADRASRSDGEDLKRGLQNDLVAEIYHARTRETVTNSQSILMPTERRGQLERAILESLSYEGFQDREDRVAIAHEATLQWALSEDASTIQNWHSTREWLECDSQIYWITGKPGSGKSTLMKYLCQPVRLQTQEVAEPEARCIKYLQKWSGTDQLYLASFYFWNSGVELQMTSIGLLRTLLYQMLLELPEVIPRVLPSRWEALFILGVMPTTWREEEVTSAFELAVDAVTSSGKLCLFIDGLDEYTGNPEKLVSLFKDLVQRNSRVKICVASRPWVAFEDAFRKAPHLRMEDLTYDDIHKYVSSNFHQEPEFKTLEIREPVFAGELVENIVKKSSGVFLWVHLVVSSLVNGMTYGDRIVDLQKRLDLLPPDLEELYERLLSSLDPFYLEHAAQLLMIMEASLEPLTTIIMSFADEETVETVTSMSWRSSSLDQLSLRHEGMVRRLNSRLKGLLEVSRPRMNPGSASSAPAQPMVQYLHRTVKDFVASEKAQTLLGPFIRKSFDPHLSLCVASWANIKACAPDDVPMEGIKASLRYAANVSIENDKEAYYDYLGAKWYDPESWGLFGQNFLSLAVRYGVTAYVRAGGQSLVPKLIQGATVQWPLLFDTYFTEPDEKRSEMLNLLLSFGADPNHPVSVIKALERENSIVWSFVYMEHDKGLSPSATTMIRALVRHGGI
ncbi:hypothetical protein PG999_003020 [Apiospora kogelbergensis]|uniref:NACHT domain-containing protein n=1 Tax=Apiospora kogelbergensis TaxID=1337665 RepID=A0AAW0RA51_9PEZI